MTNEEIQFEDILIIGDSMDIDFKKSQKKMEQMLILQKKELLENLIKEFEYGGQQYYGGSTTRLPIILEVREWLKNQLT